MRPSIEKERDGTYSVYFAGNPYATSSGHKSSSDANAWCIANGTHNAQWMAELPHYPINDLYALERGAYMLRKTRR